MSSTAINIPCDESCDSRADSIVEDVIEEIKIDVEFNEDQHSLHQLAKDNEIHTLRRVLDGLRPSRAKKILNEKDCDCFIPLHYAARYSLVDMTKLLVERGSDVNCPGEDKLTPLHLVAKFKPSQRKEKKPEQEPVPDEEDEIFFEKADSGHRIEKGLKNLLEKAARITESISHLNAVPERPKYQKIRSELPSNDQQLQASSDKDQIFSEDDTDETSDDDYCEREQANLAVLDYLLVHGARVNQKDYYGLTALHHAALRGNTAATQTLINREEISLEATDKQNMTPLHTAAIYGHAGIVRLLVESGCNVRCKDDDSGTPLQFASAEGNLEIVKILLGRSRQNTQSSLAELLDEADNDGNTPLHLAVNSGHMEVAEFLIKAAAKIDHMVALSARRNNKETPLHLAAKHGKLELVKMLVKKGAEINTRDELLSTPLILACQYNHSLVVQYLIAKGADIEAHDNDNFTAILIAANYGHTETIAVLMKSRANITAVDKNDRTVLHQCAEEGRTDALQMFLRRKKGKILLGFADKDDNTALHIAASQGNMRILKKLLDAGAHIERKNEDEQTPLHLAAIAGHVKVINELLKRHAEAVQDDDENANTALHLAAMNGQIDCIKALILGGAHIGARNAKQWTALDCCANAGMNKCAAILLEYDAPVDPKDKRNVTPLHLACQRGHPEMVQLLLDWKADVTIRAVDGRNALDFAIDCGNVECAQVLIRSETWKDSLRNRTESICSGQRINTPMRKLIKKMPSVAVEAFGRCMSDNGKNSEDLKYEVSFDYEFLDDEFLCGKWVSEEDLTSLESLSLIPDSKIYDEHGKVNPEAVPYDNDVKLLVENHPLMIMVRSKRANLLEHPLPASLLNHKWKSFGFHSYMLNLAFYILFVCVFNAYMLTAVPPYLIDRSKTSKGCQVVLENVTAAAEFWGTGCQCYQGYQQPLHFLVWILAIVYLIVEIVQLGITGSEYFTSFTNILEFTMYSLAIITVMDVDPYDVRERWQWHIGAVVLLLSWFNLILFLKKTPEYGIYVLMFNSVVKTFLSLSVILILFVLMFAFPFHVLLRNQPWFEFPWNAAIKTSVMMIGEFEYTAIFDAMRTSDAFEDQMLYTTLTNILFVVFMVMMSIVVMNLLVGLAVDDIKGVQDNAVLKRLSILVESTLEVEYRLPKFFRSRYLRNRRYRSYQPNLYRSSNPLVKFFHSERFLDANAIREAIKPTMTETEAIQQDVEQVHSKLKQLRQTVQQEIKNLKNQNDDIEGMLKGIVKQLHVNWKKKDDSED